MPKSVAEAGRDFRALEEPLLAQATMGAPGSLGTRAEVEAELDQIIEAVRSFWAKDPDQVLMEIMAYGARLSEMYVLLHRVETRDRQYQRVRTQQVETVLKELDRQQRVASRLIEVRRQDLELMR